MAFKKAPAGFDCPYKNACPHLEELSTSWVFSTHQQQWRLEGQIRALERDAEQLQNEKEELRNERDQIRAQFTALHRRQFKGKKVSREPSPDRKADKPRKRGPPIGHPPWQRPAPSHVDKTVHVAAPSICPHCACDKLSGSSDVVEQTQEDIVIQPRPHVTLFRHNTAFCPKCRRPVYATAPGELRNCSIGPTTKSVGVWLHHQLRLPFRQVQQLFASLFNMSFVPGSALQFSLTAAEKSEPLYDDLREKIRASTLLHLDETSWRLDGVPAWLWYAGNSDLDFFHINPSRATEVIANILGDDFAGDIVSDGYAVYDVIIARWRQTCLAHIIRTARDIASEIQLIEDHKPYESDIVFANAIAKFFSEVCALDRKRQAGRLSRKQARSMIPALRRRLKSICAVKLSHKKTLNLSDRLISPERDTNKLFTFLTRPGMPPTNNHAERALRGPVISRKISFGSRSESGARAFAILASLIGTAHRQNQPSLNFLCNLFTADIETARASLYQSSA